MNVPLLDLKKQYQTLKNEIEPVLLSIAESQMLILGSEVSKLEETLANYCNVKFAVGVSSGTDALLVALMCLNIGPDDEVIMPTYSFFATAGVVARLFAKPVFVDSLPNTYNINPDLIEAKITARTKAIIPVHLYGQSCEMDRILEIGRKHNIPIIEDAAQAIGCCYRDDSPIGSMGLMGCFSFYPTKNLGGFGDGGLVTTNDPAIYEKLKQMRNHGMDPKYYHKFVGGNFRLDALQAAVLNIKFPHLDNWHEQRRQNANIYYNAFINAGLASKIGSIEFSENDKVLLPIALYQNSGFKNYHIYNQFIVRVENRDELRTYLTNNSIGTEIYYPVPFHKQECFAKVVSESDAYPIADRFAAESLALPIFPELEKEQIEYVVQTIANYYCK